MPMNHYEEQQTSPVDDHAFTLGEIGPPQQQHKSKHGSTAAAARGGEGGRRRSSSSSSRSHSSQKGRGCRTSQRIFVVAPTTDDYPSLSPPSSIFSSPTTTLPTLSNIAASATQLMCVQDVLLMRAGCSSIYFRTFSVATLPALSSEHGKIYHFSSTEPPDRSERHSHRMTHPKSCNPPPPTLPSYRSRESSLDGSRTVVLH
ncbi:hypothetical protein BDZ45DRAFT_429863 [Acephala macrosclerotiorum]|nr:hypothetical protein BDZ45DRAFT_429863 [Acephala macrosclerotiorum]